MKILHRLAALRGTFTRGTGHIVMDANVLMTELDTVAVGQVSAAGKTRYFKYSHEDMIDFIIANPQVTQGQLAARYGYSQAWICQVMQSDAWQSMAAKRRAEIVDPVLLSTVNERFHAMTVRSIERLMEKLDAPMVSDAVVLKAVELGAKAMGIGGNAAPAPPPQDHLAQLANRLLDLQSQVRVAHQGAVYENEVPTLP